MTGPLVTLHATLKPGDIIGGRYKILSVIGAGSYSTVYHAEDLKIEGARWAIKELREGNIGAKEREIAVRLFKKEADLLRKLNHPGIPKIIDHFSYGEHHFMVLEYIEGETLQARIERQAIDTRSLVTMAIKICDILGYLHSLKPFPLIYRDLKPSNIMISSGGRVKLIDFGIVRFFKPLRAKDTCFLGTPGFCPPEQYGTCQSNVNNDIYSLGATLYYLLTGVDLEHFHYNVPPISHFNGSVPRRLQEIIERCMKIDPAKRYRSMLMLRRDLEKVDDRDTAPMCAPSPASTMLHRPISRITRLLKDASCRTRILGAPPLITRLLLDFPCMKNSLSLLSQGRLQPRPINHAAPILWTGVILFLAVIFALSSFVEPYCRAQRARNAEKERYRAIVTLLNAFPARNVSLFSTAENPAEPSHDTTPDAGTHVIPDYETNPAIPEAQPETITIIEYPDAPKIIPKAPVRTPPPLGLSQKGEETENSISFKGEDGNTLDYRVPQASPASRYRSIEQIRNSHEDYAPCSARTDITRNHHTFSSASNSPAPYNAPYSSQQSGYGFIPASSPSMGINDSTFNSHKTDYGFFPASRP